MKDPKHDKGNYYEFGTERQVKKPIFNELDFDAIDNVTYRLINTHDLTTFYDNHPDTINNLITLTNSSLSLAYTSGDLRAQRAVQQALFNLYQSYLAEPLSDACRNQYDPILVQVRNRLERGWLEHERQRYGSLPEDLNPDDFVDQLRDLWCSHQASHHPLFDYLEAEASERQIYYFFKSDSALNLLFFDLVAMTLVGSLPETRGEISRNLWDEIEEVSNEFTHVNLYKDLLSRRGIDLPDDHYSHLYDWRH